MDDPLAEVSEIDWASLNHAYGAAIDIPQVLHHLAQPNLSEEELLGIYRDLYSKLYHQGTRYSASVATAPFLLRLADRPGTLQRQRLFQYLIVLAIGDPDSHMKQGGFNIAARRAEAEEMLEDGYVERKLDHIVDAQDDLDRHLREMRVMRRLIEQRIQQRQIGVQVYDAVKDGLPIFQRALNSSEVTLRAVALYALSWFPEEIEQTQSVLFEFIGKEQQEALRGTALYYLAFLQQSRSLAGEYPNPSLVHGLSEVFEQTQQGDFAHLCAALALGRLGAAQTPHIGELLRKIADPTYLSDFDSRDSDGVLPFIVPNTTYLVLTALRATRGCEFPNVPLTLAAALSTLSEESATSRLFGFTEIALRSAFDGKPLHNLPPFDSLSAPQQAVVRALAGITNFHWFFTQDDLCAKLGGWGLPDTLETIRAYASVTQAVYNEK
uniref:Uncharacterized protein n=1 Tax=Mycena chlorophos TaxID=658473 RepID=A0ABQ0L9B1_MYCCL|nr:predicted protein [Mycena chlorophos]